ncbi:MAG: hypothetical protein RBT75_12015 [Anaerolineae bacterium]|jgi:hypothetical protein|nr:hypothetical protein [Anaerolineae bacterium]
MKVKDLQVQYITNADGEKTAVVLPLEVFQELLETISDLDEENDPDTGLSLQAPLQARLEQQKKSVENGGRGVSLDAVRQDLNS